MTDHILSVELVYNDDGTLASYTYTEGDDSEKPSCQTVCIFTYNDRGELITYEERSRDYKERKGENHITSYENSVRTGITYDHLTISEDRTETLTRRLLTTYDNRSNTTFVDAYTPNEDGVLEKVYSAFTVYDALNREIHYTSRKAINLNNPPKYPCEIFVTYDDDSNVIQITEKQKEDIEYYGADRTETRDYQNGTLCLETTELSWTDEEGNQHYPIDILPYIAGQADFEYSSQKFVNNVLFYEQKLEKNHDPDADSSVFSTYIYYEPYNLKETGQSIKTVLVKTYKKDGTWEYVTSTYEKDILRQRETENKENEKQTVGEGILLSRTVTSKIEIFDADGILSSTEICSYTYHETTYLASIDGEIYDGDGNLTKRYRKEYSDAGELLTSTEESVA